MRVSSSLRKNLLERSIFNEIASRFGIQTKTRTSNFVEARLKEIYDQRKQEVRHWNDQVMPLSSRNGYKEKFSFLEKEVQARLNRYFPDKVYSYWHKGTSSKEIEKEFFVLNWMRASAWYHIDPVELAQNLENVDIHEMGSKWREDFLPAFELLKGNVRVRNCLAFRYNQLGSFNGSLLVLNGKTFLAMEGPDEHNLPQFFYELLNSKSSLLVRLTPEFEKGTSRCVNYWKNRVVENQLKLPLNSITTKPIDYIFIDEWDDGSAMNVDRLITKVKEGREAMKDKKGPIAVHCSAGVGRTGTYIAAYAIIDEILSQIERGVPVDQLQISIEKIVLTLSMQRYATVSNKVQYASLYNLTNTFIESLNR